MNNTEIVFRSLSEDEKKLLLKGQIIWRGAKAYSYCTRCDNLVRINKPIIGGVHVCVIGTGDDKST